MTSSTSPGLHANARLKGIHKISDEKIGGVAGIPLRTRRSRQRAWRFIWLRYNVVVKKRQKEKKEFFNELKGKENFTVSLDKI